MIRREFNQSEGIFYSWYEGKTTIEEALEYVEEIIGHAELPRDLLILEDQTKREIGYSMSQEAVDTIVTAIRRMMAHFDSARVAAVHEKALPQAYTMVYKQAVHLPTFQYEIFATEESARSWLLTGSAPGWVPV